MTTDNIHFRILESIARDLSGEVNFPTCLDAAIMVRNKLKDPNIDLSQVAKAVAIEPLIASKLLRLANSVAYNPAGSSISDVKTSISRVGFEVVRITSLAVAMDQIMKSKNLSHFDQFARLTWDHSLKTAAIARVLARRIGRVSPDEALLAGLVHDIGIFYLLYRAAEFEEYLEHPKNVIELVVGWHESIGESLLHILGLPEHIIEAIRDHDHLRNTENPCNLSDVVYFANLLAGGNFEWLSGTPHPEQDEIMANARERYGALLEEAEQDIADMKSALSC